MNNIKYYIREYVRLNVWNPIDVCDREPILDYVWESICRPISRSSHKIDPVVYTKYLSNKIKE